MDQDYLAWLDPKEPDHDLQAEYSIELPTDERYCKSSA